MFERRSFLAGATGLAALGSAARASAAAGPLYGSIGRIKAVPGQREALVRAILSGSRGMAGCLSYVGALDAADADAIWGTEVGADTASHDASLALPAVRAAIARARPLIAGFDSGVETVPVGGIGLTP